MARSFSVCSGGFALGHTGPLAHWQTLLCPGTSHLPWDTHLPPFTHTLPPTRPFFNFYTLFAYFNFSPHFSATLPPLESTFYPRSRFYTLFTPLGASLFTYPFFTLLQRGRHYYPIPIEGGLIAHIPPREALLPIYPRGRPYYPYTPEGGIITLFTLREALLPYSH